MTASAHPPSLQTRSTLALALVFALRMFGMFSILPVLALHANNLPGGSSHVLIGIALGIDGLTQACLQIPSGLLSDRFGRKPVIYAGLMLFALGSFVAGSSDNIYIIILGRLLQGTGAISAAIMALLADLTTEENRSKSMAVIGMSIGITFGASMVFGPALAHLIGVPGIFILTGILAFVAMGVVRFIIPDPQHSTIHADAETIPGRIRSVLKNTELLRLNFGIFCVHAVLRAMFVVLPFVLIATGKLPGADHWKVYLPVLGISFILAVPAIILAERYGLMKPVFCSAVALLGFSLLLMAFSIDHYRGVLSALFLFFLAFNLLEATLPSLVSKVAEPGNKGTAIGVYNSCQFIGLFLGGTCGGLLAQNFGPSSVFAFSAALTAIWLGVALFMRVPPSRTPPLL